MSNTSNQFIHYSLYASSALFCGSLHHLYKFKYVLDYKDALYADFFYLFVFALKIFQLLISLGQSFLECFTCL